MPSTTFYNLPEEKRERLLAAARAEFARTSYAEASVNRIIQAAGIPRGSFYMYFTDKEELFRYLMERYGDMLVERFASLLDREGGDLFAAFLDLYDEIASRLGGGPCRELAKWGFQGVELKPDRQGRLPEEALLEAIDGETILVSVMLVNNETGAIFPVEAAARAIRRKKAPALLHVDAVQAFGKLPFTPKKLGADLVTVSAHKIHGPKGIGALYVGKGVRILPHVFGGGQERGLRSGTESAPLIGAFGEAARLLPDPREALGKVGALNALLREKLRELPDVTVHSPEDGLPYVLNFSAGAVRGETMLHFLAQRQVYVSSGSACGKAKPSHVLEAMGLPPQQVSSALRASFSRFSTREDVEALAQGLQEGLERLARG